MVEKALPAELSLWEDDLSASDRNCADAEVHEVTLGATGKRGRP